jgi:hypothetical protein
MATVLLTSFRESIVQRMQRTVDGGMLPRGSLAKEGTIIRTALLIALGVALAAVRPGLGDETEASGKSGLAAQRHSQRTAASDQDNPTRDDSFGAEDHVRHHGAPGVSLGKSEEGVVVVGVNAGSPAARAGLRAGDEIRNAHGVALPISRAKIGGNPLQSRGSDVHPSAPSEGQRTDGQIGQRIRALEGQIYRLQQELNEARYTRSTRAADAFDASAWWERQHRGQADNDPALFQ